MQDLVASSDKKAYCEDMNFHHLQHYTHSHDVTLASVIKRWTAIRPVGSMTCPAGSRWLQRHFATFFHSSEILLNSLKGHHEVNFCFLTSHLCSHLSYMSCDGEVKHKTKSRQKQTNFSYTYIFFYQPITNQCARKKSTQCSLQQRQFLIHSGSPLMDHLFKFLFNSYLFK